MSENLNQKNEFISLKALLASENRTQIYNQILKTYKNTKTKLSRQTLPKIIKILSFETSKKSQDFKILTEASDDLKIALSLIEGIDHQSQYLQNTIEENDNSNLTAKVEHKEYELLLMYNETLEENVDDLAHRQMQCNSSNLYNS